MVRRFGPLLCALSLVALVALPACGGGHDASEKQLNELRSEIVKLRAQTAVLTERLDAVEIAQGTFRGARAGDKSAGADAPAKPGGSAGDRPDLTVVKLRPEPPPEPAPAGEAEPDEGPRTVIRSVGGGAVVEDKGGGDSSADAPAPSSRDRGKKPRAPSFSGGAANKAEKSGAKGPSPSGAAGVQP